MHSGPPLKFGEPQARGRHSAGEGLRESSGCAARCEASHCGMTRVFKAGLSKHKLRNLTIARFGREMPTPSAAFPASRPVPAAARPPGIASAAEAGRGHGAREGSERAFRAARAARHRTVVAWLLIGLMRRCGKTRFSCLRMLCAAVVRCRCRAPDLCRTTRRVFDEAFRRHLCGAEPSLGDGRG